MFFQTWVISPSDGSGDTVISDNPVTFTVAGGVTYTVTPVSLRIRKPSQDAHYQLT